MYEDERKTLFHDERRKRKGNGDPFSVPSIPKPPSAFKYKSIEEISTMTSSVGRLGLAVVCPISRPRLLIRRPTPAVLYSATRWLGSSSTASSGSQSGNNGEERYATGNFCGCRSVQHPLSSFPTAKRLYFSTTPRQHHQPPASNTDNHTTTPSNVKSSQEEQEFGDHDKDIEEEASSSSKPPSLMLKDERLLCGEHLDPDGTVLPSSDWIHVIGTLPIGSLNQILESIERWLREEEQKGIIDLDAEWNPVHDPQVPLVSLEDLTEKQKPIIEAAHVVLSPFGRPNGWHLKLANRSLVYSILARGQENHLRVGWKVVKVEEYHYSKERHEREDPAFAENGGLVVDDSMVRIENCAHDLESDYIRYILSRYDLAHEGNTVLKWKGKTDDGKIAPLMYIVRFASASWARAAVRELQSSTINGKVVKLIQYPKQIRFQDS